MRVMSRIARLEEDAAARIPKPELRHHRIMRLLRADPAAMAMARALNETRDPLTDPPAPPDRVARLQAELTAWLRANEAA